VARRFAVKVAGNQKVNTVVSQISVLTKPGATKKKRRAAIRPERKLTK
jgi:hypothetical protein